LGGCEPAEEYARAVLADAVVVDALNTSRWGDRQIYGQLRDGGVTAINATLAVWDDFRTLLTNIEDWYGWFTEFADVIRSVRTVADVWAAKKENRTGVIFGLQTTAPLGGDVRRVRLLRELGVRIIQLTYNERNLVGDGCYESTNVGLSRFGHEVIAELNEAGVLIDVSHCGERTTVEAIAASAAPIAMTHANPRACYDHPRNKSDAAIEFLAERGGVIGANAFPLFFPHGYDATLEQYVDVIEYLIELVGIEHVGIGTDFCCGQPYEWFRWVFSTSHGHRPPENMPTLPEPHRQLIGFEDATHFTDLTSALLRRGYSPSETLKVLGGNWIRLFTEVWA
jgi:membrane dipeptidase